MQKEEIHILEDIPKCEVYLMPLGDTTERNKQNCEEAINI